MESIDLNSIFEQNNALYSVLQNQELPESVKEIFTYLENDENTERINCPNFEPTLEWLNVVNPLSLHDLKEQIVVLDFFTYCCINCLHILPILSDVEKRFKPEDGVVVIGVHSSKFENESNSSNIRNAMQRYEINHPVVNDHDCVLWDKLSIVCWPTLLIIGPSNKILFSLVGENNASLLPLLVEGCVEFYSEQNILKPFSFLNEYINVAIDKSDSLLSYPGKLKFNVSGDQLAISDSGNHRIIITDSSGFILNTVGGNYPGFADGTFLEARFNHPQGLAWLNMCLFVADTRNHAIRQIDFESKFVTTIVGNGVKSNDKIGGKTGGNQSLCSPWDLEIGPLPKLKKNGVFNMNSLLQTSPLQSTTNSPHTISNHLTYHSKDLVTPLPPPMMHLSASSDVLLPPIPLPPSIPLPPPSIPSPPSIPLPPMSTELNDDKSSKSIVNVLYIAMAGNHQIWALLLEDGPWINGGNYSKYTCFSYAGSGKEESRNNSYSNRAGFAQPSGLSFGLVGANKVPSLFIADSESSSIRVLYLDEGSVKSLVGASKDPDNLFCYGDIDGVAFDAKLQHPLGVCYSYEDKLLIADSYNHKLKIVELASQNCVTLNNDSVHFNEPSDLDIKPDSDLIFIADTNNHSIKTASITCFPELSIKEFELKKFPIIKIDTEQSSSKNNTSSKRLLTITHDPISCINDVDLIFSLKIGLQNYLHFSSEPTSTWTACSDADHSVVNIMPSNGSIENDLVQNFTVRLNGKEFDSTPINLTISCTIFCCSDAGTCMMKKIVFKQSVYSQNIKKYTLTNLVSLNHIFE